MLTHRSCVLLLLAACATSAPAPARVAPPTAPPPTVSLPDAAELLRAVEAKYATATTYADRGTVTTVFTGRHPFTDKLTFETAFVRNQRLRFEYRSNHEFKGKILGTDRYVIWSDFVHTYTEWTVRPGIIDDGPDVGMPLGAAAGVSSSSSVTVSTLLMPDLRGRPWTRRLRSPRTDGSESIDGHACWRITATERQGDPITIWIDSGTNLLRRLRSGHHFAEFDTESTMEFEPTLGQPIEVASLESPDVTTNPPVPRPAVPDRRRWIGVRFEGDTSKIQIVIPGSPAERAGLKAGDTVVTIDGKKVASPTEVVMGVLDAAAGTPIRLTIMRAGATSVVSVVPETPKDPMTLMRDQVLDKAAPPFDLKVVVGTGSAKLADLVGSVVIVDFWSTACEPCERQVPHLNELARENPGLKVIGISSDEPDDIRQYAKDNKVAFALAADPSDITWAAYAGTAYPTLVVIDKAGLVRHIEIGAGRDTSQLDALVKKLLR